MNHAIEEGLANHRRVLLMGSDCPWLGADVLKKADAALDQGAAVVLVPAVDGGYVLVGASVRCGAMFREVPWGTSTVLEITRQRLEAAGLSWLELSPLRDIDRPQDLDLLPENLSHRERAPKF
jgi:glycosyltransferase A (GT-A) superfamily protein (DUF2064 family)